MAYSLTGPKTIYATDQTGLDANDLTKFRTQPLSVDVTILREVFSKVAKHQKAGALGQISLNINDRFIIPDPSFKDPFQFPPGPFNPAPDPQIAVQAVELKYQMPGPQELWVTDDLTFYRKYQAEDDATLPYLNEIFAKVLYHRQKGSPFTVTADGISYFITDPNFATKNV
jgi:hypothetical protein